MQKKKMLEKKKKIKASNRKSWIKIFQFKNHRPLTAYRSHTMCGIRGAQRSKTRTHTHERLRMAVTVALVLALPAVVPGSRAGHYVQCVNVQIRLTDQAKLRTESLLGLGLEHSDRHHTRHCRVSASFLLCVSLYIRYGVCVCVCVMTLLSASLHRQ